MNLIKDEREEIFNLLKRIRKRDFSGNTGIALKNSLYQFSTNFVAKLGSLIFTIILARLLLPELFGLYSLALSTILIFSAISDIGINNSIIRFISKELASERLGKAKAYLIYLIKIKFFSTLISIGLLLALSKFISENLYQKPILLALIAGPIYIIFINALSISQSVLQALNKFKNILFEEAIFQTSRILLVSLAVVISLKYLLSNNVVVFFVIIGLAASYLVASVFLWSFVRKTKLLESRKYTLSKDQKKKINRFLVILSTTVFSGLFFSYIDKLMLGHFVSAEYIGYYTVAFSFVIAASALASVGNALLPVFSRMKKSNLEKGFKKSIKLFSVASIVIIAFILIFSNWIIILVYGSEYLPAANLLRILSLASFTLPVIGIYTSYFISKGKPQAVAKMAITSTVVNIVLSYTLIISLIKYGDLTATFGVAAATLISQLFYLGGLVVLRKRGLKKENLPEQ